MKGTVLPKDLTVGPPLPVLLLFSLPMFASMFFQQVYNLADSWIAGHYIGAVSLGAVGTCYPVTVFFIAIASGLSIGTSIYCSEQFGAGNYGNVRTAVTTSLLSFLPFSILLMVLGLLACPGILNWLSVPGGAAVPAGQYLSIYIAGLPFVFLYNLSAGILNGLGNSKLPLIFLVLSSLLNIGLDLVLVRIFSLGISGLAMATLLSQAASAMAAFFAVSNLYRQLRKDVPRLLSPPILREILSLGIPSVIQHVFVSTGQLALQNIINSYGVIIMTGYSISFRINGLFINSLMALSNALSSFIAQNHGAGQYERIKKGYFICLFIGGCFASAVTLLLLSGGSDILSLFIGAEPRKSEIIGAGMGFIRIVVPFYLLVCLKIVTDGALRGIGKMNAFMMSSISDVLVRLFLGSPFSNRWGITGIWWIWPLAWAVGTAISFIAYRRAAE